MSFVLKNLEQHFSDGIVASSSVNGEDVAIVTRERLLDVALHLKETPELAFDLPLDVTAVDYLNYPEPKPSPARFEVVYHLRSLKHRRHLRLKVRVAEEEAQVDSLCSVWRGVGWFERETWDMLGIHFKNHPDLRRILLYPEFQGHPLRKDYPVRGYQPTMAMPTLSADTVAGAPPSKEEE